MIPGDGWLLERCDPNLHSVEKMSVSSSGLGRNVVKLISACFGKKIVGDARGGI